MHHLKIIKYLFFTIISINMILLNGCIQHHADTSLCYLYSKDKDSIAVKMTKEGAHVSGQLIYALYEKDRNEGTIAGEMHKDTLIADYTFQSEGMTSIREVAFLLRDSCLIEGYGEMIEESGKMIFKNKKMLSFSNTILKKKKCNN